VERSINTDARTQREMVLSAVNRTFLVHSELTYDDMAVYAYVQAES